MILNVTLHPPQVRVPQSCLLAKSLQHHFVILMIQVFLGLGSIYLYNKYIELLSGCIFHCAIGIATEIPLVQTLNKKFHHTECAAAAAIQPALIMLLICIVVHRRNVPLKLEVYIFS